MLSVNFLTSILGEYIHTVAQSLTFSHTLPRYGNIISTKAILDKNTNKCKG